MQFSPYTYDNNVLHRKAEGKALGLVKNAWSEHAFESLKFPFKELTARFV